MFQFRFQQPRALAFIVALYLAGYNAKLWPLGDPTSSDYIVDPLMSHHGN